MTLIKCIQSRRFNDFEIEVYNWIRSNPNIRIIDVKHKMLNHDTEYFDVIHFMTIIYDEYRVDEIILFY